MFSRFCYFYHCIFVLYCTAPMFLFHSYRRIISNSMIIMMMMYSGALKLQDWTLDNERLNNVGLNIGQ